MLAPPNVDKAARTAESVCQQLGIDTVSIYIMRGKLFGVSTPGNSYFIDDEDGKLYLYADDEEG